MLHALSRKRIGQLTLSLGMSKTTQNSLSKIIYSTKLKESQVNLLQTYLHQEETTSSKHFIRPILILWLLEQMLSPLIGYKNLCIPSFQFDSTCFAKKYQTGSPKIQLYMGCWNCYYIHFQNRHQQFKIPKSKASYSVGITLWPEMR